MEVKRSIKEAFFVLGKLGSSQDGENFVQKLWEEANEAFEQIAPFVKRDPDGSVSAVWGAMSDFSLSFLPWEENFSKGLYLAGAEVTEDCPEVEGWTLWKIPGFESLCVKAEGEHSFQEGLSFLKERNLPLVGAVQELYLPKENGQCYLLFPIRKLKGSQASLEEI